MRALQLRFSDRSIYRSLCRPTAASSRPDDNHNSAILFIGLLVISWCRWGKPLAAHVSIIFLLGMGFECFILIHDLSELDKHWISALSLYGSIFSDRLKGGTENAVKTQHTYTRVGTMQDEMTQKLDQINMRWLVKTY